MLTGCCARVLGARPGERLIAVATRPVAVHACGVQSWRRILLSGSDGTETPGKLARETDGRCAAQHAGHSIGAIRQRCPSSCVEVIV